MEKMRFFLLILSLISCLIASGQSCMPGSGQLSQTDIDNFSTNYPGCTEILGTISTKYDVTNLNGLSQLTKINGTLSISSNEITSLSGLENIDTIGNTLLISACPNLGNIDALNNLKKCNWIFLESNDELHHINSFNKLESIERLYIRYNSNLESFTGFELITEIDRIQYEGNGSNVVLPVFENLQKINEFLIFWYSDLDSIKSTTWFPSLDTISTLSIDGLNNLTQIEQFPELNYIENLQISGTDLTEFNTFSNVTSMNDILITNNNFLQEITGLVNCNPSDINNIRIYNNPMLSECSIKSLCEYLPANHNIYNNNTNCNSATEIINNCCPDTLKLNWEPLLSGTYKSAGHIYLETDSIGSNQNIILSHGLDSTIYIPSNFTIKPNTTIEIKNTGCN